MSESLFRRLCEAHPASLQRLSYQYRMNGDVMALCNDLTYSGRLRCGTASIEHQRLFIPNLGALPPPQAPPPSSIMKPFDQQDQRESSIVAAGSRLNSAWQGKTPSTALQRDGQLRTTPWLREVLDPHRRVIFLDTDAISMGGRRGSSVHQGAFAGLEVRSAAGEGGGGRGTLVNAVECTVVRLLAWGLDVAGFDLGGVGVISPYRSQVTRFPLWSMLWFV